MIAFGTNILGVDEYFMTISNISAASLSAAVPSGETFPLKQNRPQMSNIGN